jgi:hypothetical protein
MTILAQELPRLNIPECYLALYENPPEITAGARLILVYCRNMPTNWPRRMKKSGFSTINFRKKICA